MPKPAGRVVIPDEIVYDGNRYRVTRIGNYAFAGCERLTAVTLPQGIVEIGMNAFNGDGKLRSITFNCDSLANAYNAFNGCGALDTLVLGDNVRVMPPFAFSELGSIRHIGLQSLHPVAMKNLFFGSTSQATLSVGERVGQIPPFLCYNFTGLHSVDFEGESLSLTTIGQCAFAGCTGLRNVAIPANVSRIEPYAFAHCTPQSLTFLSKRPPSASEIAFYGIDSHTPVYIPCSTRGVYANSGIGRIFGNLVYMDDCQGGGEAEVIYIHDTVYVHDTVYLPYKEFVDSFFSKPADTAEAEETVSDEGDEEEEETWLFIDGKVLRISRATQMRGASVRVFDDKGRLVVDERIPDDQPADNYYIKLPKRQRYFLRVDMGTPIMVDVSSQEIKL